MDVRSKFSQLFGVSKPFLEWHGKLFVKLINNPLPILIGRDNSVPYKKRINAKRWYIISVESEKSL